MLQCCMLHMASVQCNRVFISILQAYPLVSCLLEFTIVISCWHRCFHMSKGMEDVILAAIRAFILRFPCFVLLITSSFLSHIFPFNPLSLLPFLLIPRSFSTFSFLIPCSLSSYLFSFNFLPLLPFLLIHFECNTCFVFLSRGMIMPSIMSVWEVSQCVWCLLMCDVPSWLGLVGTRDSWELIMLELPEKWKVAHQC